MLGTGAISSSSLYSYLVVEAVIGIRAAGKTKKPPDTDSLHCEPMGDGLRLGFCKPSMMLLSVHTSLNRYLPYKLGL
jgi:hypothetical protein